MPLADDGRLKTTVTVPGVLKWQRTKVTLDGLGRRPITGVSASVNDGGMFFMAQVIGQFGLEGTLQKGLRELLQKPVSPIRSSGSL